MKLVYTAEAVEDLERLRVFVAENDPAAAGRVAAELVQRVEQLQAFPLMGRPVVWAPDPDSLRDMVLGHYVVRYSVHTETLIVLRIWHELEDRRYE